MAFYRVFTPFVDLRNGSRKAVKFAKLLEDGRRLENLSWRLTFRGLEPPGAGYHDSDPKRNRVKTLAPEFDDGVLLHITMAPGNVGEGTYRGERGVRP